MYKIHNLRTANGVCHSAGNDTFYETEEEALQRAQYYASNSVENTEMVVYKAAFIVRQVSQPVEVINLITGGIHDG
jgi:hypothetical protein